jgi:transposase
MAKRSEVAALEARRFEAARWFARGESQAAVARAFGVTAVAAHRWFQVWQAQGKAGLKAAGRLGRKPTLDGAQLAQLDTALRHGPLAHGFPTDLWTLPRIATVLERLTGVRHHPAHVWRLLQKLNWSLQRPARQARERDERAIRRWVRERWPQGKKTPGVGTRGSSSRTKAGSRSFGRPPHLGAPGPDPRPEAYAQRLAARVGRGRAGLSLGWPVGPAVLPDTSHPLSRPGRRELPPRAASPLPPPAGGPALGRPPAHRGRVAQRYLVTQRHWLTIERLPAYAPELNPVEALWGNVKGQECANLCAPDRRGLVRPLHHGLRRVRARPHLAFSFLAHAGLSL